MPGYRHHVIARFVFVLALLAIPLTGCSALSLMQQQDPRSGRNWTQAPANQSNEAENQTGRVQGTNPRIRTVEVGASVHAEAPVLAGSAAVAATIREEGEDWIGTRYRYGGTTRRGIDCSAFVQQLMRDALDIQLPRTTATQVHEGTQIDRDNLLPGDLVFFRRRGVRHVGVYLGDGEFIHASSSRGVIISDLTEGYYNRHYWTARRVLENPARFVPISAQEENEREILRPGSRRTRTQDRNPRSSW